MSHYKQSTTDGKDPLLWKIAQKRATFKRHAIVYVIVNVFLWARWFFIGTEACGNSGNMYPRPIWTTLGWRIGLVFHFAGAYVLSKEDSTARDYQKLKIKK